MQRRRTHSLNPAFWRSLRDMRGNFRELVRHRRFGKSECQRRSRYGLHQVSAEAPFALLRFTRQARPPNELCHVIAPSLRILPPDLACAWRRGGRKADGYRACFSNRPSPATTTAKACGRRHSHPEFPLDQPMVRKLRDRARIASLAMGIGQFDGWQARQARSPADNAGERSLQVRERPARPPRKVSDTTGSSISCFAGPDVTTRPVSIR